jgi:hypothetical protein
VSSFGHRHRVEDAQSVLTGPDYLVSRALRCATEVRLALGESQRPLLEFPVAVALAVIVPQDPLDGRPDLLGSLPVAGGDSFLESLPFLTCPLDRLFTRCLFGAAAFVAIDDDHARIGIPGRDFLDAGAWRIGLPFPGRDAVGTIDPLRVVDGVEPDVALGVATPLDPHEKPLRIVRDGRAVRVGDPPPRAADDESTELEVMAPVTHDFWNWRMIDPVARPDRRSARRGRDHHHADAHPHVPRLALAAGAVRGAVHRPRALEGGAGDGVAHPVGREAEAVAQAVVQRHVDPVLGRVERVERAVPSVARPRIDADPPALGPVGEDASARALADEVGREPAGAPVLTGGGQEPVGDEHDDAVGARTAVGPAAVGVAEVPEAAWAEHGANGADRPQVAASATWGSAAAPAAPPASPARSRRGVGSSATRRSVRPSAATTRGWT